MLWFACIVSVFSLALCLEKYEVLPNKELYDMILQMKFQMSEQQDKFDKLQDEMFTVKQRLAITEKVNQGMQTETKHLREENDLQQKQIAALENTMNLMRMTKNKSMGDEDIVHYKVSNVSKELAQDIRQRGNESSQNLPDFNKRLLLPNDTTHRIAFCVGLTRAVPLGYHKSINYDKIITNIGNSYDQNKGHFAAPYKGLYLLSATIMNELSYTQSIEMVRNGIQIAALYGDSDDKNMSSQTIIVLLEQGDKVWLRKYGQQNTAYLFGKSDGPYNTFSGVLLFEM